MTVTLDEVLHELGIRIDENNGERKTAYCPSCDNQTADLNIYNNQSFCCYGGNSIDGGEHPATLVAHTQNISYEAATNWLQEHFPDSFESDLSDEDLERRTQARKVLSKAAEICNDTLMKQKDTLREGIRKERNITDEQLKQIQVGYMSRDDEQLLKSRFDRQALIDSGLFKENSDTGELFTTMTDRVTLPYTQGNTVYYMAGRSTEKHPDNKYVKAWTTPYNQHILYQFQNGTQELVIPEGFWDAISASLAGYTVASPATKIFRNDDHSKIRRIAQNYDTVYLAFDMDEAGQKGKRKTAETLAQSGIDPEMVDIPEGKDLDDWTTANGYDISELLENSESFLEKLIDEVNETESEEKLFELFQIISSDSYSEFKTSKYLHSVEIGRKSEREKWFKDWKQEHQQPKANTTAQSQVETSESDEDSEEVDGDTLRPQLELPNGDTIGLNPSQRIQIISHDHTASKKVATDDGLVDFTNQYKVYNFTIGHGAEEEEYKLITEPWRTLNLGENELPIKEADLTKEVYKNSQKLKDDYSEYASNVEDPVSYEKYLEDESSHYFEISSSVSEQGEKTIQKLEPSQINELIEEYLNNGWHIDPTLKFLMYPKLLQHDKTIAEPKDLMPYSDHTQLWTASKIGKSSVAERVGIMQQEARAAGLLGYADSDGKRVGTIDGETQNLFFDEVDLSNQDQKLNDRLLSIMEGGSHSQSKAGFKVTTEYYGSFTYMANPGNKNDDQRQASKKENVSGVSFYSTNTTGAELVEDFENLIEALGYNTQALGTRFGCILFNPDSREFGEEGTGLVKAKKQYDISNERRHKLATFVNWCVEQVNTDLTELFLENREWMEQGYSEAYRNTVQGLVTDIYNDMVAEFWLNQPDSYRHSRGMALRKAFFDNWGRVIQQDITENELLSSAGEAFSRIEEINLDGLGRMADTDASDAYLSQKKAILNDQDPKYVRLFVKTVIQHHHSNNMDGEDYIPVSMLGDTFKAIREDLPDNDVTQDSKYWKYSQIETKIKDGHSRWKEEVENRFGIKILERQGAILYKISKPGTFELFQQMDSLSIDQ